MTPLVPGALTLTDVRAYLAGERALRLDDGCWSGVRASAATIEAIARQFAPPALPLPPLPSRSFAVS